MIKYEITEINDDFIIDEMIVEVPHDITPETVEQYLIAHIERTTGEKPERIAFSEILPCEGDEMDILGVTHRAVWVYEWSIPELEYGKSELCEEDAAYIAKFEAKYKYYTPCTDHAGDWIIDEFAWNELDQKYGKLALVWVVVK